MDRGVVVVAIHAAGGGRAVSVRVDHCGSQVVAVRGDIDVVERCPVGPGAAVDAVDLEIARSQVVVVGIPEQCAAPSPSG
jgi:hypothetical protein